MKPEKENLNPKKYKNLNSIKRNFNKMEFKMNKFIKKKKTICDSIDSSEIIKAKSKSKNKNKQVLHSTTFEKQYLT